MARTNPVCCVRGQSVIFFYGADDAPSCSKQIMAMDQVLPEFESMGVKVVGGAQTAREESRMHTLSERPSRRTDSW